jgi:hypothetical protein
MDGFLADFAWPRRAGLLTALAVCLGAVACGSSNQSAEAQGSAASQLACSSDDANKLASAALSVDGESSGGRCYHYVKQHLRDAGFDITPVDGQVGAYEFGEWADAHPDELSQMGFQKITPDLDQIPKGSILVWDRGQCGYSADYGHIEIVVDDDSSKACSDFCGHIKKDCGSPGIYAPNGCVSGSGSPPGALDNDPSASIDDGTTDDGSSAAAPASSGKTAGLSGTGQIETCKASFYDDTQTASGERFDGSALTAAHKTLPFNTMVRVTNTSNGKTVDVRINDRGPFVAGRCIDLTTAAFDQIADESAGVAPVTVEVLQ